MRILVSEFVCGGGWAAGEIPSSIADEGRAMAEAVIGDLLLLEDVEVFSTWDARLRPLRIENASNLHVATVTSTDDEQECLSLWAEQCDLGLVIAPEFDGILETRCQQLRSQGLVLVNCHDDAIRLCSDKLHLAQACQESDIATIPTIPFTKSPPWETSVVKRRDGAGSIAMRRISSGEWSTAMRGFDSEQFIAQPFIAGRTLSIAAIFENSRLLTLLPPAEQHLASDGSFAYLGGIMPAEAIDLAPLQCLVQRCADRISGLHGYVGFDVILPTESQAPVLVEINPRLTTSYVGYRQISELNLAAWLMGRVEGAARFTGSVQFAASGESVQFSSGGGIVRPAHRQGANH